MRQANSHNSNDVTVSNVRKHPFNPYYLSLWYAGFLTLLSIFILSASSNTVGIFYSFLEKNNVESLVLSLNKFREIKNFLLSDAQASRWEMIAAYYSVIIFTFPVVTALIIYLTPAYLRYVQQQDVAKSWNVPLSKDGKRVVSSALFIGLFVFLIAIIDTFTGRHDLGKSYKYMNSIQVDDIGFFKQVFSCWMMHFAINAIQFSRFRLSADKRLSVHKSN